MIETLFYCAAFMITYCNYGNTLVRDIKCILCDIHANVHTPNVIFNNLTTIVIDLIFRLTCQFPSLGISLPHQ